VGRGSDNYGREIAMKYLLMFASLMLASSLALAQAQTQAQTEAQAQAPTQRKPCEELKAEIDAKLQQKGVKSYTLDIIPNENVKEEKVVGSCDGGTKKITYKRG
jgi:uncharacterized protein DUF1161